ncbi:MAG: alpha/beta hydrolase, partial [Oscillospiraceae bacterium]|nr:alpha/beta hydrolase [Oscillospiraceae bacterium]
ALSMALSYRKLGKQYRVYVFSRRDPLPAAYSIRDMAADQARAMELLGMEKAHVLGVSQGGMIAQHLAADHPEKLGKLILAVSAGRSAPATRELLARWMALMEQGDYGEIMVDTAERSYSEAYLKTYRFLYPVLRRMGRPRDTQRFITQARACMEHDASGELGSIRAPTLVIGGDEDRIVGSDAARELHKAIPGSKMLVYKGLSHAAYEEARDFQERVLAFLET